MIENEKVLPSIDQGLCSGCGQCAEACPTGALQMVEGLPCLAAPEACGYCANCEDLCPQGAIGLAYEIEFEENQEPTGEK